MAGLLYEHPLLGTRGQLGHSVGRPRRYTEEPQVHLGQNDASSDALLVYLHALRLQGSAPQLAAVRLPCHQCHSPVCAGPTLPPLSLWRKGSVGVNAAHQLNPPPDPNHGRAMPLQMFTQQQLQQFTAATRNAHANCTGHQSQPVGGSNCHIKHPPSWLNLITGQTEVVMPLRLTFDCSV